MTTALRKPQRYCWLARDMLNRPSYDGVWWRQLENAKGDAWVDLVYEYQMLASGALQSELD